jgi:phenylacetate-CoA ligase
MHDWLAPRIIFPAHERISGHRFWSQFLELKNLQWMPEAQLEERALQKLKRLITHAYENVPYYREAFLGAGVSPDDIVSLIPMDRVPITTKADIRRNFPGNITAQNIPSKRRETKRTSGSTGLPLEFYADLGGMDAVRSSYLLLWGWAGIAPWVPGFHILSPAHHDFEPGLRSTLSRFIRRLLLGERLIPLEAHKLRPEKLAEGIRSLGKGTRYFIWAPPSRACRLARTMEEDGIDLPEYPCALISYAETLSAIDREVLQSAFRCPVFNYYGSEEVPFLAQTCPDNPQVLHVNSERALVRVVRENGTNAIPGERGRVIITDFSNYVMPLINYDMGDYAVKGDRCPCGRGFPTLERVEGRAFEAVTTPAGLSYPSGMLSDFLCLEWGAVPYVWEYQFVQTGPADVQLRIVPTRLFSSDVEKILKANFEELLQWEVRVQIELVDQVEVEPSGKRFVVKSNLWT